MRLRSLTDFRVDQLPSIELDEDELLKRLDEVTGKVPLTVTSETSWFDDLLDSQVESARNLYPDLIRAQWGIKHPGEQMPEAELQAVLEEVLIEKRKEAEKQFKMMLKIERGLKKVGKFLVSGKLIAQVVACLAVVILVPVGLLMLTANSNTLALLGLLSLVLGILGPCSVLFINRNK